MASLRRALGGITIIRYLIENESLRQILRTFRSYFGEEANAARLYYHDRTSIPWGIIRDRDSTYNIFVGGVTHPSQFKGIAIAYLDIFESSRTTLGNGAARAAANFIRSQVSPEIIPNVRFPIRLFGHSYGGMVCEELASQLVAAGHREIEIVTYGTPKLGYPGAYTSAAGVDRTRYMMFGDPVPLLPCGQQVNDNAIYIAIAQAARGIVAAPFDPSRCVHPGGGIVIGRGVPFHSYDARGTTNPSIALQRFVDGEDANLTAHLAGSYGTELRRLLEETESTTTVPVPPQEIIQPDEQVDLVIGMNLDVNGRRGINFALPFPLPFGENPGRPDVVNVDRARATATARGISVRALIGRLAMANAKLKPTTGFSRVKADGKWFVYWAGIFVAETRSGSRAKTVCKRGNAFLRYMANLSWFGPELPAAAEAFIIRAVAGDGYNPPLDAAG